MNRLLDYLLYALLGHNYSVQRCGKGWRGLHEWCITFEEHVRIIIDEKDILAIRTLLADCEDIEGRDRYTNLLSQLV